MDAPVRIRLASAIRVDRAGRSLSGRELGSRKARTLLALLASERGRLVPADRISDVLWAEEPPADPAANVSTLVSRTRRLLGDGVLAGTGRAYGLLEHGGWSVDLDEAAALLDEAGTRLAAGEHALVVAGSRRALDLLGTQPALVDEPDADWVRGVRREAEGLRTHARHLLVSALTASQPGAAEEVARQAVLADPFDERAVRDLMRAAVAAGRPAAALTAYDALASRLRDELGTDPAAATAELHLAVLRESALPADPAPAPGRSTSPELVGRDRELHDLEAAWAAAGEGHGRLLLVEGEAGIGKTRLVDAVAALAERTGGRVLRSRCHPTERSLFLQPYVDALRPVLLDQREPVLAELVSGHEAVWTTLLPDLAEVLPAGPRESGTAAIRRRRAYDAVVAVVRRLAVRRPVLLAVDDLHDGGAASVDLLGYLAQRLAGARVLLLAAVRTEHQETVARLADRAERVRLGALRASAVDALASAAGLAAHGPAVMARTGGHPLSVVECLRALAAGDPGVPASLADAVSRRVAILPPGPRDAVEAASVLGQQVEPRRLADLAGTTELAAVRHCEELVQARLLVRSGAHYEFANDLVQECVLASLVPALAVAYHRRAADLTTDRPETMAEHAFAAGDRERAAQGWLLAGEAAMGRSAVEDAADLFGRGLDTTTDPVLRARLLLARAVAGEARTAYGPALADIEEALSLARATGNRRLEMDALRARGGDVPIGLHLPTTDVLGHLESALLIATELGARRAEADIGARLTILDVSRLRLTSALARAERMLARLGTCTRTSACPRSTGSRPRWPTSATWTGWVRWSTSSSRCCGGAARPGCCSGPSSRRRSCRRRQGPGTTPAPASTRRCGSTGAPGTPPTPGSSRRTRAGSTGSPATSTAPWCTAAVPSSSPPTPTTPGGTPPPAGCSPRRWWTRVARPRRRPRRGRGWPRRHPGRPRRGGCAAPHRWRPSPTPTWTGDSPASCSAVSSAHPGRPGWRAPTATCWWAGPHATGHARRGRRAARRAAAGDGDALELGAGPARRARPQMSSVSSRAACCAPPGGTGR